MKPSHSDSVNSWHIASEPNKPNMSAELTHHVTRINRLDPFLMLQISSCNNLRLDDTRVGVEHNIVYSVFTLVLLFIFMCCVKKKEKKKFTAVTSTQ